MIFVVADIDDLGAVVDVVLVMVMVVDINKCVELRCL